MPHRRSSSSATDSTASDDGWGWDDAPHRRGRRRSEDETASSSGSSGDSRRGKRRKRGNSAAYDTDSSSDGSSSDEDEKHGARPHYHKRKKKRPPSMLLEYGVGGLLVLVVLGAAVAFMMSDSSSAEGATPSATGSQAIVTKDTTVQASGGTAKPSASASKPASSKAPSSSPSPKPAAPASSKAPPAAAPTDGGESAPAPAPAPSSDNSGPYKLVQDCSGENFFSDDCWTFWDADDPTHGSVNYLSKDDATKSGLISTSTTSAIMVGLCSPLGDVQSLVDPRTPQRVDNTTELAAGAFRDSVRVHSTASVPLGSLIIADIVAMPYGCGTWPAWWMNGPDWPAGGELDILEGVSLQEINQISVHTSSSDCKRDETAKTTGTLVEANDDCNANNKGNTGCSYAEVAANSYGKSFNDAGGGVFATIFTKDAVSQYFWSRPDIPENIKSDSPDVSDWGIPSATWPSSTCDSKFWGEQTLIFDITLCGDWAGAAGVWSNGCSDAAPTCVEYVQQASPWTTAVFEVAYVRVYTM